MTRCWNRQCWNCMKQFRTIFASLMSIFRLEHYSNIEYHCCLSQVSNIEWQFCFKTVFTYWTSTFSFEAVFTYWMSHFAFDFFSHIGCLPVAWNVFQILNVNGLHFSCFTRWTSLVDWGTFSNYWMSNFCFEKIRAVSYTVYNTLVPKRFHILNVTKLFRSC